MAGLVDTMVGEYRVVRLLGQGGMGEVYEALHPIIGKRVAVKVLKGIVTGDGAQATRFIEEARAVTGIHHPSIVDVFGFGTLPNGQLYLLMDLLQGTSFHEYLGAHAPLAPQEAIHWLIELLDAIAAAHRAGVVHRDLKPSNLFLVGPEEKRTLKVLDFGIARRSGRSEPLTRPNMLLGSPSYVAPEQIRGEAGFATDLYAIGCIAWGMLTGRVLFKGPVVLEVLNRHLLEVPAPPSSIVPGISRGLDEFVLRLLAKEPVDRPPSAEVARDELRVLGFAEGRKNRPTIQVDEAEVSAAMAAISQPSAAPTDEPAGDQTVDERRAADVQWVGEPTSGAPPPAPAHQPASHRIIAGAIGLGLAGALTLVLAITTQAPSPEPARVRVAEPAAAPPTPPTAAVPVEDPPAPAPPPPAVVPTRPAVARTAPARSAEVAHAPRAPSLRELGERLQRDEAAVKEGRARGGRNAAMLLEDARERLARPMPADRLDLQAFLDEWEGRYLR